MRKRLLLLLAVLGPSLISAFADNDAGGVATYSVAASKYGYSILTTLIPITVVLMITQELGARIAIVTKKGLGQLIRERFGLKLSILIFGLLLSVNFGVILQNMSGLKSALEVFNLDYRIFLPIFTLLLYLLIEKGSFRRIEKVFVILIVFYITYLVSAILSKPDWGLVARSLVVPSGKISFDFLYTAIAVLGTTVTAWGQFFIDSFTKERHLTPRQLRYEDKDVYASAILTNIFSLFMMVAVAATIFQAGIIISGPAEAALAIKPLAGNLAGILFAVGLLIASFLGCAIVPLATAYAFSEFFGKRASLNETFKKDKWFYGVFLGLIVIGTVAVYFPQISLFKITLYADYFNGLILPVIFFFLYKFANDEILMGEYKNSKLKNILLIGSGVVITIGALIGGMGKFIFSQ